DTQNAVEVVHNRGPGSRAKRGKRENDPGCPEHSMLPPLGQDVRTGISIHPVPGRRAAMYPRGPRSRRKNELRVCEVCSDGGRDRNAAARPALQEVYERFRVVFAAIGAGDAGPKAIRKRAIALTSSRQGLATGNTARAAGLG